MKKWLRKNRKWIAFSIVIAVMLVSIYRKEYLYKDNISYNLTVKIESCCVIDNSDSGLTYESLEDLMSSPPEYEGEQIVKINHNVPFFSEEEIKLKELFIDLSELDELGRSKTAFGLLNAGMLKIAERTEDLSVVKPTGLVQVNVKDKYNVSFNYDGYDYYYLYNRCHILAYSLGGPEVDERDIFTGTISLNIAMQTYEKAVSSFLRTHQLNYVLYRVTPVFKDNNLLASGVLLEGYSKNHLSFCAYIHNVQESFELDYRTGKASYRP